MQGQPTFDPLTTMTPEEPQLNMGDYLRRAWRRKFAIVIPCLLALIGGYIFLRNDVTERRYESTSELKEVLSEYTREVTGRDREAFSEEERIAFIRMVDALRKDVISDPAMEQVWRDNGLITGTLSIPEQWLSRVMEKLAFANARTEDGIEAEQIEALKGRLKANASKKDRSFQITFEARSPEVASRVIVKAAELFRKYHREKVQAMTEHTKAFIDRTTLRIEEELREVKNEITDFKVTNKDVDPDLLDQATLRYQSGQDLLERREQQLREMDNELARLRRKILRIPWRQTPASKEPQTREQEVHRLEQMIQALLRDYKPDHPEVKKLQNQLEFEKRRLLKERRGNALRLKRAAGAGERKLGVTEQLQLDKMVVRREMVLMGERDKRLRDERELMRTQRGETKAMLNGLLVREEPDEKTLEEIRDLKNLVASQNEALQEKAKEIDAVEKVIDRKRNVLDALQRPGVDLTDVRAQLNDTLMEEVDPEAFKDQVGISPISRVEDIPRLEDIPEDEYQILNPEFIELLEEKNLLEYHRNEMVSNITTLKEEILKIRDAFDVFPQKAVELESMRSRQQFLRDQLSGMMGRLNTVELRAALERDERGRRLKSRGVYTPDAHAWPPPPHIVLLLCLAGGLGLGVLIIIGRELTDHSFWRINQVEKKLGKTVLAAIPIIDVSKRRFRKEAIVFRSSQEIEYYSRRQTKRPRFRSKQLKRIRNNNVATEQFRKLRLKLVDSLASGKGPKTILVTSAIPEEGKTAVAANLAVAISQRIGEHVLLVDCDMRRPNVHNYFEVEEGPGLSDYLQQDTPLEQLLVKTEFDKLTLLQSGPEPLNPAELLASQRMKNLVKEMKSRYADRTIIFDSSPLLATAEPNVLASQVDGIIMVVEAGRTPSEIVEKALVSMDGHNVMGIVLNGAEYDISAHFMPKDAR